jgi:hypothetical protein
MFLIKSGIEVGHGIREIRPNNAIGITTAADTTFVNSGLDRLVPLAPSDKRMDPKPRFFRYLRPAKIAAAAPNGNRM